MNDKIQSLDSVAREFVEQIAKEGKSELAARVEKHLLQSGRSDNKALISAYEDACTEMNRSILAAADAPDKLRRNRG